MVFQAHPGDILAGKYRVDRVLGIGGMGMVVAATHLELDQMVALKFMLGELATSPSLLDRFLREARAVAKLRGEHVCRIFDVGRLDNGSPYIVMELLEGEDFAAVLSREGTLAPAAAVDFLLQAIEGVAEAHAEGIIHRDLKPGNLFITTDRDGTSLVKVLDFGISKSASAPATKTGDIMGSPGYMAPEQMSNAKATDARADVWSLGVILYQALSNRMPWNGESLPALCMSIMTDPAPALPDAIPEGLRQAVMMCLAKGRDGRFASVAALAAAIAPYGNADATSTATRITKILGSTSAIPVATSSVPVTLAGGDTKIAAGAPIGGQSAPAVTDPQTPHAIAEATVAARPPRDNTPAPAPVSATPVRPISTISSSAAEIAIPPAGKSRKPLWIGLGAIAVIGGGIAIAVGAGGSGSKTPEAPVAATPKDPPPPPAVVAETPVEHGKKLFGQKGCNACHTATAKHGIGPSIAGVWGTEIQLASGDKVMFDEAYARESIMVGRAKLRVGFSDAHPNFGGQITDLELGDLVAYIKSLANAPAPPPLVVETPKPPPAKPGNKPAVIAKPVTKPVTPPSDPKPGSGSAKPSEAIWTHMTHDKDPATKDDKK